MLIQLWTPTTLSKAAHAYILWFMPPYKPQDRAAKNYDFFIFYFSKNSFTQIFSHPPPTYPKNFSLNGPAIREELPGNASSAMSPNSSIGRAKQQY